MILSIIIYKSINNKVKEDKELEFKNLFERKVQAIQIELNNNFHILKSLNSFSAATKEIDRTQFKDFVKEFLDNNQHKSLHAISWVPRVEDKNRKEYEEKRAKELAYDFKITQKDDTGKLIEAKSKAEYFPVDYIEPYELNKKAQGYDISSNASRLETLNKAKLSKEITITSKIKLVQETKNGYGFLAVLPIWDKQNIFKGYYSAVFRITDILNYALNSVEKDTLINIWLVDITNGKNHELLYTNTEINEIKTTQTNEILTVGGRKWIVYANSTLSTKEELSSNLAILLAVYTIFGTFLLMFIIRKLEDEKDLNKIIAQRDKLLSLKVKQLKSANEMAKLGVWEYDILNDDLKWSSVLYKMFELNEKTKDSSDNDTDLNNYMHKPTYESFFALVHPKDKDYLESAYKNHLKDKKECVIKHRILLESGKTIWVINKFNSTFNEENKAINSKGYIQDITIEEENREQERTILEQSKMVSMGQMIGNIAHQWRQPLASINTAMTRLKIKSQFGELSSKELVETTKKVSDYTTYLSKTIDTFTNYIKNQKVLKEYAIEDEIKDALTIAGIVIRDNSIELINNIDLGKKNILKMTTGELSEIIINILNNAKDILLTKEELEYKWIKIDLQKVENKFIITIEDNGGGIENDIIGRVFEPYFTTKHQSQGTGLGLHMCYKIITESFKGKLSVENSENGAKFYIEIPNEESKN